MLNFLWIFMILAGIVYAALTGNLPAVTDAALDAAQQAVTLCITMAGVLAFWVGLMRIAENAGMMQRAADRIYPLLHFLFPRIPREHAACKSIAANCIANFFGLGWAATPAGLKAMEALQERNLELCGQKGTSRKRGPDIATDEMCTFLIVNISSLQLIPVNIIAYRSQYGSVNPAAVVGPGLIATICSTAAAIIFCKLKKRC